MKHLNNLMEIQQIFLIKAKDKYTIDVHKQIKRIWNDKGVQKAFQESRYEFHVFDGASHFFFRI